MADIPFIAFNKIHRLNREVIITEKIDGTNGVIFVHEDLETISVDSRSRWLSPGKKNDNFGFCEWAVDHKTELLKLGHGFHFGEWWGHGIQRGYAIHERRFSLFNVSRWADPSARPACCDCVPVVNVPTELATNMNAAAEYAMGLLRAQGSIAAPGFMRPEGVVVFHTASSAIFKALLENDQLSKREARA